ncbi:MAG: HNH endonuclease [Ilumatobacteraceae bacterium]
MLGESPEELAVAEARYRVGWERHVAHGVTMQAVVAALNAGDGAAALRWNAIDQQAVDAAFRSTIGEREKVGGVNVGWLAWKRYGLVADPSYTAPRERRARAARPTDHNAAWLRAGGVCSGCGTLTISDAQRTRLHHAMRRSALFDLEKTYAQYHGKVAPLWREVTIAAKGVAEHIVPRSQGGRTDVSNLTNCCSACNYGRSDTSLTAARIAAYRRPASEIVTPPPS